jgi:hypothetical protein
MLLDRKCTQLNFPPLYWNLYVLVTKLHFLQYQDFSFWFWMLNYFGTDRAVFLLFSVLQSPIRMYTVHSSPCLFWDLEWFSCVCVCVWHHDVREGIKVVSFESSDCGLFQNSQLCFKSPVFSALTVAQPAFFASTLVHLIFQSRSFSLGGKLVQQLQYI